MNEAASRGKSRLGGFSSFWSRRAGRAASVDENKEVIAKLDLETVKNLTGVANYRVGAVSAPDRVSSGQELSHYRRAT
jgi:hypothetical protein